MLVLLPERRLEGPRELRPGVPVAARVLPQSPEVAALGPARPRLWWPVPRPVRCPARGRERSQLSPGSAARRCDRGVLLDAGGARTRCATSGGPSQGRGVRTEDIVGWGVICPAGKCRAVGSAEKLRVWWDWRARRGADPRASASHPVTLRRDRALALRAVCRALTARARPVTLRAQSFPPPLVPSSSLAGSSRPFRHHWPLSSASVHFPFPTVPSTLGLLCWIEFPHLSSASSILVSLFFSAFEIGRASCRERVSSPV